MKYRVQVTETINHTYLIEANSRENARAIYQNYDRVELSDLDQDGASVWDSHPWEIEEDNETPAPLQIAGASSAVASPAFTASAVAPLRSAVNPCDGGEPCGFGVYCSDQSGEWIETGFSDEAAAERFADAWKNYREDNHARVGLVISNTRAEWEGYDLNEKPVLACQICDHAQEFAGWLDENDTAHFPCPNCGGIFEHDEWLAFFDDENEEEELETIGARCVIEWSDKTENVYISLGEHDAETNCDTFGVPDEQVFYYATPIEFQRLTTTKEPHADGWHIVSYEWVTQ
jgi:hypothetical protein